MNNDRWIHRRTSSTDQPTAASLDSQLIIVALSTIWNTQWLAGPTLCNCCCRRTCRCPVDAPRCNAQRPVPVSCHLNSGSVEMPACNVTVMAAPHSNHHHHQEGGQLPSHPGPHQGHGHQTVAVAHLHPGHHPSQGHLDASGAAHFKRQVGLCRRTFTHVKCTDPCIYESYFACCYSTKGRLSSPRIHLRGTVFTIGI